MLYGKHPTYGLSQCNFPQEIQYANPSCSLILSIEGATYTDQPCQEIPSRSKQLLCYKEFLGDNALYDKKRTRDI